MPVYSLDIVDLSFFYKNKQNKKSSKKLKMQFNEYNSYNDSKSFRYELSTNDNRLKCRKVEKSLKRDVSSVETFLRNVFLPEGYPDSVSDDYLSYQIWDTIQAFASSISGSLATQAVLEVNVILKCKSNSDLKLNLCVIFYFCKDIIFYFKAICILVCSIFQFSSSKL